MINVRNGIYNSMYKNAHSSININNSYNKYYKKKYSKITCLKRWVLSSHLKLEMLAQFLIVTGRSFQSFGAAIAKARSPSVLKVLRDACTPLRMMPSWLRKLNLP